MLRKKSLDTSELLDLIQESKMPFAHFYFLNCKKLNKIKFWKYCNSLTKRDIQMRSAANKRENQIIQGSPITIVLRCTMHPTDFP